MKTPTDYELAAALRVARLIDDPGNHLGDMRASYREALTQGEHADSALIVGERLLLLAGLIVADEGLLVPSTGLTALSRIDDVSAVSALRILFQQLSEDGDDSELTDERQVTGFVGEVAVVLECRSELDRLGRSDLAEGVQQVSLITDALGFDVLAPTLGAQSRKLEVKTSVVSPRHGLFRFFITRNEYEVGRRLPAEWCLVACRLEGNEVTIVGWTRASSLSAYLPDDASGRWTEALVQFPAGALIPGLPPAV